MSSVYGGRRGGISATQLMVLIGCTLGMVFHVGGVFNGSLSAFLKPITEDTGWSRAQVAFSSTIVMGCVILVLPYFGSLAERIGPRKVLLACLPFFGFGLVLVGLMPQIYYLHLAACAFYGLFGAATAGPIYMTIISRFFDARLGLALGIMSTGTGIALALLPMLAHFLIDSFGWRQAYIFMGVIVGTAMMAVAFFLLRDGEASGSDHSRPAEAEAGKPVKAWLTFRFWQAGLAYFMMAVAFSGVMVHLIPFLTDRRMDAATAASLAFFLGAGSITARLLVGVILDYFDAGLTGAFGFLLGGLGVLFITTSSDVPMTIVGISLVGFALGTETDVLPYVTRRIFGSDGYAKVVSQMGAVFLSGVLVGPVTGGLIFDILGSYESALYGIGAVSVIAAILHAPLTIHHKRRMEKNATAAALHSSH